MKKIRWTFLDEVPEVGKLLADIFIEAKLVTSKSDFRRNVEGGAIRVEDRKVSDPFARLALDTDAEEFILLQRGA